MKLLYTNRARKDIKKLDNGFVLKLPTTYNPDSFGDDVKYSKLQDIFFQAVDFSTNINVKTASELNTCVSHGNVQDIILMSESFYDRQLMNVVDEIIKKKLVFYDNNLLANEYIDVLRYAVSTFCSVKASSI